MKYILLGTALISLLAAGVEAQTPPTLTTSYTTSTQTNRQPLNALSAIAISKARWVSGTGIDMVPIPLGRTGPTVWTSSSVATSGSILLYGAQGEVLATYAPSTTWGPTPVSFTLPSPAYGYAVGVSPTTWTSQSVIYNTVIQYPQWAPGN